MRPAGWRGVRSIRLLILRSALVGSTSFAPDWQRMLLELR